MSTGAPKGNQNPVTHGIYSQFYTAAEVAAAETIELDSIDHEIVLTAIRLRRLIAHEEANNGTLQLEETIDRIGGGPQVAAHEEKRRAIDYHQLAMKFTKRLESLKRTRALLLAAGNGKGETGPVGFEVEEYDD